MRVRICIRNLVLVRVEIYIPILFIELIKNSIQDARSLLYFDLFGASPKKLCKPSKTHSIRKKKTQQF